MAKKLIDFVKEQAKKAGVNVDDDAFKAFLSTEALSTVEIPEELSKPIENSLISLTDAKNNHPDIKNYYTRQALDTADKRVEAIMEQLGFSEDDRNAVLVDRNSYNRLDLLAKAIQKAEQKKANADKPDKAAAQKQIDDLHAEVRTWKEASEKIKQEYAGKEKRMKIGYKLDGILSGYKTINDGLDAEVRSSIHQTLLDKRLQDNNAKLDLDDNGNLVLLKNDGTNFYGDSNTQINAKQFVEQTLSANKLLVVHSSAQNQNDGKGANGQTSPNGQNGTAPNGGSGKSAGATATYRELMNEAQKAATQTSPVFGG